MAACFPATRPHPWPSTQGLVPQTPTCPAIPLTGLPFPSGASFIYGGFCREHLLFTEVFVSPVPGDY